MRRPELAPMYYILALAPLCLSWCLRLLWRVFWCLPRFTLTRVLLLAQCCIGAYFALAETLASADFAAHTPAHTLLIRYGICPNAFSVFYRDFTLAFTLALSLPFTLALSLPFTLVSGAGAGTGGAGRESEEKGSGGNSRNGGREE